MSTNKFSTNLINNTNKNNRLETALSSSSSSLPSPSTVVLHSPPNRVSVFGGISETGFVKTTFQAINKNLQQNVNNNKLKFQRSSTFQVLDRPASLLTASKLNAGSKLNKGLCNSAKKHISPSKLPMKSKSVTSLNACYTPSSLYKSNLPKKIPPNSLPVTPIKTPTKRKQLPIAIFQQQQQQTPECFSKVSIETPRLLRQVSDITLKQNLAENFDQKSKEQNTSEISNLSVAVRVRPMNSLEYRKPSITNIISVSNNEVSVFAGTTADASAGVNHTFLYDHAFWSCNTEHDNYVNQNLVFEKTALPLVDQAFQGYNACLFAYGQTGSGKSYSMMGVDADDNIIDENSEAGIIPRFCQEIFRRTEQLKDKLRVEIEVSYFEIYNEKIHDLLAVTATSTSITNGSIITTTNSSHNINNNNNNSNNNQLKKSALRVREHPLWGPYIVDLSTHPVDSHNALRNWLAVGNSQRATAATGMNEKSSRSHSIFNIVLNLSDIHDGQQTKRSKISLVDLAGSERVSHTCASGERLREGVSINKSLLTLGKVIAALADTKKTNGPSTSVFVPYRESVLTWLLRENLGGNSKTVMLATISPANIHLDETLATLRYACQARTIINRVKVNEDPHDRQIRELKAEVDRLQSLQQDYERQKRYSATQLSLQPRKIIIETTVDDSEINALRQQLHETEQELKNANRSWQDRLHEAEQARKQEMRLLQRNGLALEISSAQKQPCLMNLAVDPMLSGTLLYILPKGLVKIGRSRPSAFQQPDIILDGPLVAYDHCTIENENCQLFIRPQNQDFETFINGELLMERRQIFHADRVVIGGSHYFRVSNPDCPRRSNEIVVDFQLAYQEILKEQEKRIRQELDAEKQLALTRIENERIANEQKFTEKFEKLEMEKFRYKCSKELLESEKKLILRQKEEDEKENLTQFSYTPYKSNILDEIKKIMERPSDESLHQIQLKVKEATQRCRDLDIKNIEFKQSQVADEFGFFKAVVNIIDYDRNVIADWPPARLDIWLDLMRENDIDNFDNLFLYVDIEWRTFEMDEMELLLVNSSNNNDNLNVNKSMAQKSTNRRISLNLNAVKDTILNIVPDNNNIRNLTNILTLTLQNSRKHLNSSKQQKQSKPLLKTTLIRNAVKLFEADNSPKNFKKKLLYNDFDDELTQSEDNIDNKIDIVDLSDMEQDGSPSETTTDTLNKHNCHNVLINQSIDREFATQSLKYLKDLRKSLFKLKRTCYEKCSSNNDDDSLNDKTGVKATDILHKIEKIECLSHDIQQMLLNDDNEPHTVKSIKFLID